MPPGSGTVQPASPLPRQAPAQTASQPTASSAGWHLALHAPPTLWLVRDPLSALDWPWVGSGSLHTRRGVFPGLTCQLSPAHPPGSTAELGPEAAMSQGDRDTGFLLACVHMHRLSSSLLSVPGKSGHCRGRSPAQEAPSVPEVVGWVGDGVPGRGHEGLPHQQAPGCPPAAAQAKRVSPLGPVCPQPCSRFNAHI